MFVSIIALYLRIICGADHHQVPRTSTLRKTCLAGSHNVILDKTEHETNAAPRSKTELASSGKVCAERLNHPNVHAQNFTYYWTPANWVTIDFLRQRSNFSLRRIRIMLYHTHYTPYICGLTIRLLHSFPSHQFRLR